jgi:hypothetical protein
MVSQTGKRPASRRTEDLDDHVIVGLDLDDIAWV